eukprot:Seg5580.1 transcript_id=Seg5580.1/GoldUCD/mRNA.D3Y31 product="hypothetical protein" protein_id=Seg5580.1/GoldUCD/D3Y31
MKIILVLLLGIVFTCQGIPLNEESEYAEDNGELEDATEMNEPEIANEQNEAPEDDMSEYEEDGDNESDEEEDTELVESDPKKIKKPRRKRCPIKHRFCRLIKTCTIKYKNGKKSLKCKGRTYCVCSKCPKNMVRSCHFKEEKEKKGLSYSLKCHCRK